MMAWDKTVLFVVVLGIVSLATAVVLDIVQGSSRWISITRWISLACLGILFVGILRNIVARKRIQQRKE